MRATTLGLMLAGAIVLVTSGATTGAVEAGGPLPGQGRATGGEVAASEEPAPFVMSRHTETYPLRDGQEFDRGVWCAFKKVEVYDKFHDETYYIDQKVCLGTITR